MSTPDRSQKLYTNPTNPYYDPLWSQGYTNTRSPSNLRDDDYNNDYYMDGYFNYGGGMYSGYGRGMGPGRRMYSVPVSGGGGERKKKRGLNSNRFMMG